MKKATGKTVAGDNSINSSLPRELSIEIAIWQLRIEKAKSHPERHMPWCQDSIQSMEEWILLLPVRRLYQ